MPSTSKKQHNLMAAVAHNPQFAKKVGIPQSVGKDFNQADKGKKFAKGGVPRPELQAVNKAKTEHGSLQLFSKGGSIMAKEKNGLTTATMSKVRTAAPSKDGLAERGKTKGKQIKMAGNSIGTGSAMKKGGMAKMKK
jgi:hypothetical protein